LIIIIIKGSI